MTTHPTRTLRRQQILVATLLFAGYAAYYFCRSNLSVVTPLIVDELHAQGMDRETALMRVGAISSIGVLAYALGKLLLTASADLWGGRRSFCLGLAGGSLFTVLFALGGGIPFFTIAWVGNRLTQSVGWAGMMKICSRWFDFQSHGRVIAILSLSYLVGDAAARQTMGLLIEHGASWRAVFYFGAGVAALLWLLNVLWLRNSRTEVGHAPAEANPLNLFAGHERPPASILTLMRILLCNAAFIMTCVVSLGCTLVRESLGTWTPTYLHEATRFSVASAAQWSALFPLVGAASVLVSGWASDRIGVHGRAVVLALGLAGSAAALTALAFLSTSSTAGPWLAVLLIAIISFCLLGPYSSLAGAMALDFGGAHAGAAASGLIDGVGYLGGVLAGAGIPELSAHFGWRGVYVALAAVCLASTLASGSLCLRQMRQRRV